MVQLHNLKTKTKNKTKKRVGRGGKRGAYSGKGQKGQKQHGSHGIRPQMRDVIKKIPKKRGYRFNPFRGSAVVLNLRDLEANFKTGTNINPGVLKKNNLISLKKGKLSRVKILGVGKLTKKFNISGCFVSGSAKEKIKKAGGTIK